MEVTAGQRLIDQGLLPSSFREKESESTGSVVNKWKAAVAKEARAIKESRDPKLRREQQLASKEAGISKADEALRSKGVTPEDFWISEPGLAETSFTERTGKKIAIPEGSQVGAVAREIDTPEGGMYRQIAGSRGTGTVYMPPEAAKKFAESRADEENRAIQYQQALADAGKARVARELTEGAASTATRQGWEGDKAALAEGKQIQREAGKRISRINRQLRQAGRYRQKWEGEAPTMSADQYQNLLDEKALLGETLAQREDLKGKGITRLGKEADIARKLKAVEQRNIMAAELERARSATQYGIPATQQQWDTFAPISDILTNYYNSIIAGGLNYGLGLPTSPANSGQPK